MLKLFEGVVNENKSLAQHLKEGKNMVSYIGSGYVIARLDTNAKIPFSNLPQAGHYKFYWTANKNANCNGAMAV